MDTHKVFIKLYRRLLSRSVFYIPSEFIFDGIQDMISLSLEDYSDRLLYLGKDRRSKSLQNPEAFENVSKKRFQLEKTVSYLLKQKGIMGEDSFSYLQGKYMEFVSAACYGSKELYDNVQRYFPNESLVLYKTFLLQQNILNAHRKELVSALKIANNQPYSLEDLEKMSLLQDPAIVEVFSFQSTGLQRDGLHAQPNDGVALISDEEAQDFLLKTVFSIPCERINEK